MLDLEGRVRGVRSKEDSALDSASNVKVSTSVRPSRTQAGSWRRRSESRGGPLKGLLRVLYMHGCSMYLSWPRASPHAIFY